MRNVKDESLAGAGWTEHLYRSEAGDEDSDALRFELPADFRPDETHAGGLLTFQLLSGHLTQKGCRAALEFLQGMVDKWQASPDEDYIYEFSTAELEAELTRRGIMNPSAEEGR